MKLKILSLLRYRVIYIALSLVIFILIKENVWYVMLLPFYFIYIVKNHRIIISIIVVIIVIFGINFRIKSSSSINDSAQFNVEVVKVNQDNDYTTFTCYIDGVLVNAYLSDRREVLPGDLYTVKGELQEPLHNTFPNGFDYNEYLLSKGIYYQFFIEDIEYKGHRFNLNILNYKINKYIEDKIPLSKSYIKTFILADKSDFDQDTLNAISTIGISHLFAVSGLHVGLLVLVIKKLMEKARIRDNISDVFIIVILVLYIIITAYSPSVTRAGLMFILIVINKKMNFHFSNIDLLSLIFIFLLILNPYFYKNQGFILSFLVTLLLLLSNSILKDIEGIKLLFMVSLISFIGTFPIIISMNNQINLLTLIFNIVFIMYMTYLILPLTYLTFIFPFFDIVLNIFISTYNDLIYVSSKLDMFILKGSFQYAWEFMIFYVIIFSFFRNFHNTANYYKSFSLALLIVFISLNLNQISPQKSVIFLDVKGDSTFISDSYNNCNILIDTGENDEYNSVINYLLSSNVRKLDYLFISHFHSDHYGEMFDIYDNLDVKTTITRDNVVDYHNRMIDCGSISMYIYELSYDSTNENNNSMIISIFIEDRHFLFMGDSELERELEFIEKYSIDVDYLKVSHHGSSTSSGYDFLDTVTPREAFIMVYRYNIFDHPDIFVINRYNKRNISVNRTDLMGSIEVEYLFGIERKKYYKP